ncbi:MAG: hypothetical protein J6386_25060 [Candidatus Synoicihabitans palmerolidicus]|nr:hypothetical protein [Candidatus Synoicihabitans palmerolidicus]
MRDYFDIFYAGYWDSWPALQGATGITYETNGGGKRGINHRRDDDLIMTLRMAIAKHFTASMATVATAAANRVERLRDFRRFFVSALEAGRESDLQQVWVPQGKDPHRTREMVRALRRSGVEVYETTEVSTLTQGRTYLGEVKDDVIVPAGSYVIDLAQPKGRLARALLEQDTVIDEAFVERQQAKAHRNEQRGDNVPDDDYEFYDVTAWALPLAYGVEAFQVGAAQEFVGTMIDEVPEVTVELPARATSAYVVAPGSEGALKLGLDLLTEGYRVATAVRPLNVGGVAYARGALVVRVGRNPDSLHGRIRELATEHGVEVASANTAFSETGITGIGSESTFALKAPKVLVATGAGVTPASYGALHYLFEETYGLEFVPVSVDSIKEIDLRKFNVVILSSGWPGRYGRLLGQSGKDNLKQWVTGGGTLICLRAAAELTIDADTGWTSARRVGDSDQDGDDSGDKLEDEDAEPLPVPGAMLRVKVDHEHFITFGHEEDELPFLVNTDTFFTASETGINVLTFAE